MIIIQDERKIEYGTAVALGNFDGVHLGHIELISHCRKAAEARGLKLAVLTFGKKLTELKFGSENACLTSRDQKEEMLRSLGVDILYELEFDESIKSMPPDSFMESVLKQRLNASEVFVGFNFKFGKNASGDSELLVSRGKDFGFSTTVVPPVKYGGEVVSSSRIREHIERGEMDMAARLLGRPYEIRGSVVRGKGRGKVMGFATANLKPETDYLPPKIGVYKTRTVCRGVERKSLTNVGKNPTFGDIAFSIETHILNFDDDIYGETIEVKFIDYIREEVKFSTVENLIEQVKSDIAEAERED